MAFTFWPARRPDRTAANCAELHLVQFNAILKDEFRAMTCAIKGRSESVSLSARGLLTGVFPAHDSVRHHADILISGFNRAAGGRMRGHAQSVVTVEDEWCVLVRRQGRANI